MRGVGHRARQHAVAGQPRVAEVRPARHAPAARLQPHQAAAGGRDPDRSAAVVAVRERQHPGRDRRRRAAARATGRALQVPRVAGGPGVTRLGGRQDPELRQVGHADDHEPRLAQPPDQVGRVVGPVAVQEARAVVERHPLDRHVALDRDRHAGERRRVVDRDRVGGGQRAVAVDLDERVQGALERLDPAQRGLDHLARARAARPHERSRLLGRGEGEVVHHRQPTSLAAADACPRQSPPGARPLARGCPGARRRHQRRPDPGRPDRDLRHRPAHPRLGRLGAEDDPGRVGDRPRVRRRRGRGRRQRDRLRAGRSGLRRGPPGLRPLPQLHGRAAPPVRAHRGDRGQPHRRVRRVHRAADDQRLASPPGHRPRRGVDLRPVRQRHAHGAGVPGARRGRADHRRRADRDHGRGGGPARRCAPRRHHRRE